MPHHDGSPPLSLESVDWAKIGKGLVIALIGAALAYLSQVFGIALNPPEPGPVPEGPTVSAAGPLLTVLFSVAVNVLRKWLFDTRG